MVLKETEYTTRVNAEYGCMMPPTVSGLIFMLKQQFF